MQVIVGRRYRVANVGGASEIVTAEEDPVGDVFLPVTIVPNHALLWLRIGGAVMPKMIHVSVELLPEPVPIKLRPIFGDDPGALEELRQNFRTWDFSVGTY